MAAILENGRYSR